MKTLPDWLIWIIWSGGAGIVASVAISLLEKWTAFKSAWDKVPAEIKRYISFALAGGLGALAFWIQIKAGYVESPPDLTAWLEMLFAVVVSQVMHARLKAVGK